MTKKLIFIYNADSDFMSSALDYAHKLLKPSTYKCQLCTLTHGNFGEREVWKSFKKDSNLSMEFYHKDEWEELNKYSYTYPVILQEDDGKCSVFIDALILNSLKSENELIDLIRNNITLMN